MSARSSFHNLIKRGPALSASFVLLAMNSASYNMPGYGLSSGGGTGNSANYQSHTTVGEQSGSSANSATYQINPGYISTIQANVPAAPTVTNPGEYYNKLHVVIDTGGNPTDALFAIAASDDGFVTTQYVQSDLTLGPTLGAEDWQSYATWGSGSGFDAIGLTAGTTYSFKVKATRGDFTESDWSAVDTADTIDPYLTFDLDIGPTDGESASPFTVSLGDLSAGVATTAPDLVWIDFATNGAFGGNVMVAADATGLASVSTGYTITSASADLGAGGVTSGFGLRSASATQTSGGPLTASAPYNGASDNVGLVDTTLRQIYSSSASLIGGRASIYVKAKASSLTPAATDYQSSLTVIAAVVY